MSPVAFLPRVVLKNVVPKATAIRPPIMFDRINMESQDRRVVDMAHDIAGGTAGLILESGSTSSTPVSPLESEQLVPNDLTADQEEWLMEMQWAQGAFLSSWCIAVLDNPNVFHSLRTFNIANLSSGFLSSLQRDDVWHALPNLENLTVLVSPDWRQVLKDPQGIVSTEQILPSSAQHLFCKFLSALFGRNKTIKSLKIGYVGGGEHAPGMFARNQNILPAPIMSFLTPQSGITIEDTLYLPYIEHLTLVNCWLTPTAVKTFFAEMRGTRLRTVTFDSVSLTADINASPDLALFGLHGMIDSTVAARRNMWINNDPVSGSWSNVINTITPGPGIAHARHTHGKLDEKPPLPATTALRSITFNSCGYVRLTNMPASDLNQSALPEGIAGPPHCLRKRYQDLEKKMLD
ncbi:MAG: hypothetical protein Q9225_003054, partial [Loekoesia sp. 1 TL-2023]